jgi:hypothetical protein
MWELRCASLILGLAAFGVVAQAPTIAFGDDLDKGCNPRIRQCFVSADRKPIQDRRPTPSDSVDSASNRGHSKREAEYSERARKAEFDRRVAVFERENLAYNQCILKGTSTCVRPSPPDPSLLTWFTFNGGPPVIQISPGQAGAIAVARLQLPTVAPGIGPSPDLNRWKMAAVGYPLWLWAEGPTHVGPVSDSVAGLNVSLEANVTSLTFKMGDGNRVECPGAGDKWTKAVEPGAKAPRCGYTYVEPSMPKGNYTVSAITNWAVTWTANGQSGVINVPAVQTTELPVGELQVLVR